MFALIVDVCYSYASVYGMCAYVCPSQMTQTIKFVKPMPNKNLALAA